MTGLQKTKKVETRDHLKNGAIPKSQKGIQKILNSNLMKKIVLKKMSLTINYILKKSFLIFLIFLSSKVILGQTKQTLAVLPIVNTKIQIKVSYQEQKEKNKEKTESKDVYSLDFMVTNRNSIETIIIEKILKIPVYRIIERADMDQIIEEQNLIKNNIVDQQQSVKLGKLLGAELLLIPQIMDIEESHEGDPKHPTSTDLLIKATTCIKIINVESGEIIFASYGHGRYRTSEGSSYLPAIIEGFNICIDDLYSFINKNFNTSLEISGTRQMKKSPTKAVFLSIIPGAGQFYADNPTKGIKTLTGVPICAIGGYFLTQGPKDWEKITGWVLIGAGVITYLESFFDAYNSTKKYNLEISLVPNQFDRNGRNVELCVLYRF